MARIKISHKTPIDPLFSIPIGAEEEFTHTRDLEDDIFEVDEEIEPTDSDEEFYLSVEDELDFEGDHQTMLATPTINAIISQVVRRAPGGQQVIDVVIEVEDVAGTKEYEIKVTKI